MSIYDREHIRDILITACEGGINYWANIQKKSYSAIVLIIRDNDTNKTFWLSYEDIVSGFARAVRDGYSFSDIACLDAIESDIVIQYACFGKVIYG